MPSARPKVFIVGGGFGGIAAAKALSRAEADLVLLDKRNHHVFQPLLYQVATAALSPADISSSIRSILRHQLNCQVAMAEVLGIDTKGRHLLFRGGRIRYDYLILAAGATHAYFGHPEWSHIAPGLKTLDDATEMRRRILLAFESAEYEGSEEARRARLTFGIVGGGPTGVELAGAIKEIAGETLPEEYRHIDTRTTRVIIFEGGDRLLGQFHPKLSAKAKADLEKMGVEVRLNAIVTEVTPKGVSIGGEQISLRNVFWAAGVRASPLAGTLGVELDRSGRVPVGPDLTINGHPEIFVIGDMASARSNDTNAPVPGVAQAAIQMGRYAGRIVANEIGGGPRASREPFRYRDRGSMAIIGKSRAVAQIGRFQFDGFVAWLLWGAVHIAFLVNFRDRLQVLASWLFYWLMNARDARLITGEARLEVEVPRPSELIREEPPGHEPSLPRAGGE